MLWTTNCNTIMNSFMRIQYSRLIRNKANTEAKLTKKNSLQTRGNLDEQHASHISHAPVLTVSDAFGSPQPRPIEICMHPPAQATVRHNAAHCVVAQGQTKHVFNKKKTQFAVQREVTRGPWQPKRQTTSSKRSYAHFQERSPDSLAHSHFPQRALHGLQQKGALTHQTTQRAAFRTQKIAKSGGESG